MAEDLVGNLQTYTAQLQQVEAALTNDPENEELLKLKTDLQEVIQLTEDLLAAKPSVSEVNDDESTTSRPAWHVGDTCQAVYSIDGLYYNAIIDDINDNGEVTVTFDEYGNTEVVQLSTLKVADVKDTDATKRTSTEAHLDKPKSKKELIAAQREYKRRKAAKKAQRVKDLETQREDEKSKWQQFNNKTFSKTKKGLVKRSIFASPDSVSGRVGVGTCGTGGRPMTQFEQPKHVVVRK
ncbi:survival of motor neuron-related-splicing factor 30-like [Ptychodera flava]|uniref:survival of motor neuron-related-splicing factor 30-like n=1 Tax=Ptychodera flava TaxID=63121 RepID=UPI00396A16E3